MTDIIHSNSNNDSPFDSIKRFDENGQEYWSARELMTVMGYLKWQFFIKSVDQAKENMELAGDVITDHLTPTRKMVKRTQGGGVDQEDFKLSRYAAYHTALACDGRKPEVALAKKYFVIKTRKAEILETQPAVSPQLPITRSVLEYIAMAEKMGFSDNQHIKLYAERLTIKEMGLLASGDDAKTQINSDPLARLTTCTIRAVELGYTVKGDNGSNLGKWVKARVKPHDKKIQEGQYMVYGYWLNNELDNAIHSYYAQKAKLLH
jgi:hypothetical protein